MKNIQPIVDLNAYEAFGFPIQNKPDQVTYIYSRGLTHTTGGGLYYRTFTGLLEAEVSNPIPIIPFTGEHIGGASGGLMGDSNTAIFYVVNHTGGTRDIYIMKSDADHNFTTPVLFDWTNIVKLTGGFFYGPMITGDVPGEYYHILYQTAPSRYRISIVKTTDYWQTYSEIGVLYDGTLSFSETAGINLGGGKFVGFSRLNNSGILIPFESTNHGVTWVRRPTSSLYWYNGGSPEIPWVYGHDGVFDIFYECRDTSMMHISKGNTVTSNFGLTTPVYNPHEIYYYHRGTGGNPSLGYGSQIKMSNAKYFMIFSKEYTSTRANLHWTVDDLVSDSTQAITTTNNNPIGSITITDPAPGPGISYSLDGVDYSNTMGVFNGLNLGGYNISAKTVVGQGDVPVAPEILVSGISATSFRIDITNYGDWQKVRYLTMDLSTQPDFSTFVTAKYRSISSYPAVPIQNIRMTGYWNTFNILTTQTIYYLRVIAYNNQGQSGPTLKTITTL